jgi:hypothetical protein
VCGGSINVEAVRLDDYVQQIDRDFHFVKIDVEGAEGFVSRGMEQLRKTGRRLSLLLEFSSMRLEAAGCDPAELLQGLESQGFHIRDPSSPMNHSTSTNSADVLRQLKDKVYINLLLERDDDVAASPR